MRKREINITVQYALRYFLVVAVTVLSLFMLIGWILQNHKNTLVNNIKENVYTFMLDLDTSITKQQTVAQEIFLDELTAPGSIDSHPIQTVKGIKQLELYQSSLLLNDFLFLRYSGEEELILYDGTISLEGFMSSILKLEEESKEVLRKMLEDYSGPENAILTGENGQNTFIWCYPFKNGFTGKRGVVSFGITGKTMEAYLYDKVQNIPFCAVLIDDTGKELFEIRELAGISETDMEGIREKMLKGEEVLVKEYTTDVYTSVNGFTFCIVLDDDYILADFKHIVVIVLLSGSIIFMVVIFLTFYVNHIHVNQIKKVRDNLIDLQNEKEKYNRNEFSQIQDLIKGIYQEQCRNTEERDYLNKTMAEFIAKLLLSGKLQQREDMLEELVNLFCRGLKNQYYTVLSVIAVGSSVEFVEKLVENTSVITCSGETAHNSNLLYLVMGLPDADCKGDKREAMAAKLLDKASEEGIRNLFVVTGRTYEYLHEVSLAYQDVLLLTNILLEGNNEVIGKAFVFEKAMQETVGNTMTKENKWLLSKALKEGTVEEANDLISALADQVIQLEEAGKESREWVVRTLADYLEEIFRENGCDKKLLGPLQTADFEDIASLKKYALNLIAEMKVNKTTSIEEILEYINTNYKDNTMGLDVLAVQFNMSVSNISRKIKDSIGENFSDYIFRIRIEEACRLLRETDISVRNIPVEVGYSDYSSFSRKFKNKMGVTLKEYRKRECSGEAND